MYCVLFSGLDISNALIGSTFMLKISKILRQYKEQNDLLKSSVTQEIYSMIILQNVASKITSLKAYLNS